MTLTELKAKIYILNIVTESSMITEKVLEGMFKPVERPWKTSITKVEPNSLTTRVIGNRNIIGSISFSEMVYLLVKGEIPSAKNKKMLEAILVSFCDHGVTPPSTQSARLMASAGSPINACIAGGILTFGENHAGAIENTMKNLQEEINYQKFTIAPSESANFIVEDHNINGKKVPGFGHRYHTEDPRARKLLKLQNNMNAMENILNCI